MRNSKKRYMFIFSMRNLEVRDHLGDQGINSRIIQKLILLAEGPVTVLDYSVET